MQGVLVITFLAGVLITGYFVMWFDFFCGGVGFLHYGLFVVWICRLCLLNGIRVWLCLTS